MKRENDKGELHIDELDQTEIHNPLLALRAFTEDFSLESVRQLIKTMRDVCITTENVFYGNAGTREDLLHVTRHMVRFFEAAYLYIANDKRQVEKDAVPVLDGIKPGLAPKFLRVLQRSIPSTNGNKPYSFPILTMSGNWLEKAGFYAGDEVKLVIAPRQIQIINLEWEEDRKIVQRA